ncbi:MerR family transcriptional regulator [Nocardia mangyaensis]|uniref:MerR family transcriptional regulator n=1 Tax=Nocardia mangyaensis TaxID=2213200 RepID=A0A1J0VNT1_9NOCA|nr:MerR family transcriptional regulator [Nocardia mangyaensis]APE33647.1 MerR family transcriptional regulator [Nocardia mangyaensis]
MGDEQSRHLQIGEVAARTDLSIRTVRHYHDVGLVTPSERSAGGFRLYTEADVQRLLVIRRMKPLGFTLAEMKELLEALEVLADSNSSAVLRRQAGATLDVLRGKAESSCANLRRQLGCAEELTELLTTRLAAEDSSATR